MRHDRCFPNLLNRSGGEAMAESNKPGAQGAKDEGANKGAKATTPSSQDNDDVSEIPADPNNDPGR